jgi:hypothetical protein
MTLLFHQLLRTVELQVKEPGKTIKSLNASLNDSWVWGRGIIHRPSLLGGYKATLEALQFVLQKARASPDAYTLDQGNLVCILVLL